MTVDRWLKSLFVPRRGSVESSTTWRKRHVAALSMLALALDGADEVPISADGLRRVALNVGAGEFSGAGH